MLVVLTSHPIQYQAPLWRVLAEELGKQHTAYGAGHTEGPPLPCNYWSERGMQHAAEGGGVSFEVWFLTDQGVRRTEDRDFGKAFAWDVDLLSGYPHRFLGLRGKWDMHKFNGIRLAQPIGDSLRRAGATALWVEGWRFKPFWDAVSAAKKMGIPVFLRGETSDKIPEKGGLFGLARNLALRRLFAKVDHFLAIGQASRRFYLKLGVPERKLVDAPYCVDNEFFRRESGKIRGLQDNETTGSRERGARGAHFEKDHFEPSNNATAPRHILTEGQKAIREEWNIPADAKVVMFCGKFVAKKRPVDVVRAAQAHETRGPQDNRPTQHPWHLLFVGSGQLGEELRAACDVRFDAECAQSADQRTNGLRDDRRQETAEAGGERGSVSGAMLHTPCSLPPASFVGFLNQSQISKAYAVADVLVLPSEAWETWGLVVNEATAAGLPTVVSDQCGCADDFAANNPATKIFPAGNIPDLAKAVDAALALDLPPREIAAHADAFSPRVTAEAVARLLS